jgi:hypothetical protein
MVVMAMMMGRHGNDDGPRHLIPRGAAESHNKLMVLGIHAFLSRKTRAAIQTDDTHIGWPECPIIRRFRCNSSVRPYQLGNSMDIQPGSLE